MKISSSINPWVEFWRAPQKTIHTILSKNPRFCYPCVAGIYGLPITFHIMQSLSAGKGLPLFWNFILALVLCMPVGMIGLTILGNFIFWTGKWFDAHGSVEKIKVAIAWSNLPGIFTIFLWLIWLANFKNGVLLNSFTQQITFLQNPQLLSNYACVYVPFIIQSLVGIWCFIVSINSLARVQQISIAKAFFNLVIPIAILAEGSALLSLLF